LSLSIFVEHRRVGIDSNVFIYLFEGSGQNADAAGALLDAIAAGEGEGVVATLAIAEVGSGPARGGDIAMVERYADELSSLEGVRVVPLDASIAVESALIRGATSLTLADAVHVATARSAGATAFVTNDRRLSMDHGLTVAYLDDLLPSVA
jgi:predicted nucleic acid-binding protein